MIVANKRPRRGELVFTVLNKDEATHYVGWATKGSRLTTRLTVSVRGVGNRPDGNEYLSELQFLDALVWDAKKGLAGAWVPKHQSASVADG